MPRLRDSRGRFIRAGTISAPAPSVGGGSVERHPGGEIRGFDDVIRTLQLRIDAIRGASMEGLFAGALIVQADAQRNVPVEFGNLRASAFTRFSPTDSDTVEVGFTAAYAVFVHENMEQVLKGEPRPSGLGTYWNPGGPKFLERALDENRAAILEQIRRRARIR